MAEQIPPTEQVDVPSLYPSDNPPEPSLSLPRNDSLSVSVRAERGSPAPEQFDIDSLPPTPAGSSVQLQDPAPSSSSCSSYPIADPFQQTVSGLEPLPSVALCTTAPPEPDQFSQQGSSKQQGPNHPSDPQEIQVNSVLFNQLLELGFDDWTSQLALIRTGNTSVEVAVQWIVERSNESDFESGSDSEKEEDAGMGGVNSSEGASAGVVAAAQDMVKQLAKNSRTHKMVFVANMSLKMGTGKLAAQVGHACLGVYQHAMKSEEGRAGIDSWTRLGQVKIVLKGQSTEQLMDLFKAAKDAGCHAYLVQDAGYTQIPPGSRTILGIFGTKEAVDSVTGELKLL